MRLRRTTFSAAFLVAILAFPAGMARAADPVQVQDRMQLADGLFRRGMFDLASREYAELAGKKGIDGLDIVLFRLGECYRRVGRTELAETAYVRLIDNFPNSPYLGRARLQSALIQLEKGGASLEKAAASFEKLTASTMPAEVRSAALYHWGETLEKLGRTADALAKYNELKKTFANTDYGMYSSLRIAWLLTSSGKAEDREKAMGIYLDLIAKATTPKVTEEAQYLAAQVALLDQRYDQSSKLFLQLRKNFPNSPHIKESALAAAWANFYSGRYKEASEVLDLVLADSAYPHREEVLYLKANCLRVLEQRRDAVAWYGKQMGEFPKGPYFEKAWSEQLSTYYRDGDYSNVLAVVSKRIQPPAKDEDHVYWMASDAALALGRSEIAVENARLLVTKCPKSPLVKDALYRLGWLLQKGNAWEAAAGWYLKISELYPADPIASKALYASGCCHAALNQREMALRDWTQLLARFPNSDEAPEALYQKAMEELRGKDYRAAGATLDERIHRFPDDNRKADVLYWRGSIYQQAGDAAEAEKKYRACLASVPSKEIEREAILGLGSILYQEDKKAEAAKLFQQLLDAPEAANLGGERLVWLAEFQLTQKQLDASLAAAQALIALKPDKGYLQTAWTLAGRVYRAKDQRDAAMNAFREALKTDASTTYAVEAALRLGELLTDAGQFDEARKSLEDAASRASAPELIGMRAHAYAALARNAELKGDEEIALRYYMSVGILFDDKELVPASLENAVRLLDILGRPDEAKSMREELKKRYPDYKGKSEVKK